jgi:hypothetical protein
MVKVRHLAVDEHFSLRGETLDECIQSDIKQGLIPFFVRYFYLINNIEKIFVKIGLWNIRYNIMLFI